MTPAVPARSLMSIGEVLSALRPEFPDVTISKIRFLESEGLVEPARTPSGYRKFSRNDVERLRYVLSAQRDHYLPLRVIKEHLDAIDRGLVPAGTNEDGARPRVHHVVVAGDGAPEAGSFSSDAADVRLSRSELAEGAGIDLALLDEIESHGLVSARPGSVHYDGDALVVARIVAEMSSYGLEPRHLRAFRTAAERETGLVEQVVAPLLRQRDPQARARAEEVAREMAALSVALHTALVRAALRSVVRR
ncbi:MAG: transcriptional regulator FtsR [Actinomycetes bacterium]